LSLPSNSDAPPNGWPVTISQNYIQLAGLNGNPIAGDLSAAALEIGGGPVTCEDNTVGVASNAPEAIMVSTPDSILGDTTQVENQCYGEPLTGPQGPNGLAIQGEAGGNWDTAIVGGNSSLAAMDTAAPVPTNTFAGPAYYPGAPTTFNNNWTAP
jgi:hypothetical protein